MALNINGRMKVKTLRADFKKEFGLTLRVYDGRSFADDDATLASIRKGDSKGGEFSPKRNTKVGNLEDKIEEMFGIKTQVAGSDDSYLCDNDLTLAGTLEADEKLMAKRKKRENDTMISPAQGDEDNGNIIDDIKSQLKDVDFLDELIEDVTNHKALKYWGEKVAGISNDLAEKIFQEAENSIESSEEARELSMAVYDEFLNKEWATRLLEKSLELSDEPLDKKYAGAVYWSIDKEKSKQLFREAIEETEDADLLLEFRESILKTGYEQLSELLEEVENKIEKTAEWSRQILDLVKWNENEEKKSELIERAIEMAYGYRALIYTADFLNDEGLIEKAEMVREKALDSLIEEDSEGGYEIVEYLRELIDVDEIERAKKSFKKFRDSVSSEVLEIIKDELDDDYKLINDDENINETINENDNTWKVVASEREGENKDKLILLYEKDGENYIVIGKLNEYNDCKVEIYIDGDMYEDIDDLETMDPDELSSNNFTESLAELFPNILSIPVDKIDELDIIDAFEEFGPSYS